MTSFKKVIQEITDRDQLDIYQLEKDIIDLKIDKIESEDEEAKKDIDQQIEDKKEQIQNIKDLSESLETKNLKFHYHDFDNIPRLITAIKNSI